MTVHSLGCPNGRATECGTNVTSRKKHSPRGRHRATLDAYIRAGHHRIDERRAKPIRQIAAETGMDPVTARYWLKRDHCAEHLRWWPNAELLLAEAAAERTQRASLSRPVPLELAEPDADAIAAARERIQ